MWRILISTFTAFLVLGFPTASPPQESEPVKTVMRLKLEYTRQVLESIIREESHALKDLSFKLVVLTGTEDWKVIRTEEYNRNTADFVGAVEALRTTRGRYDINETAQAYIDMTLSCVRCHKYVREYQDGLTNK